jgi:hypothetical protein
MQWLPGSVLACSLLAAAESVFVWRFILCVNYVFVNNIMVTERICQKCQHTSTVFDSFVASETGDSSDFYEYLTTRE